MLSGEKVTGSVGGDLNIESKQDSNSYKEKNTSAGLNLDLNLNNGKIGVSGGASKENIDSNYNSVTDQSGIYAGEEGFDITVGNNTDLKGGIIGSEATSDKNKISTGTLTYEDIDNKAEYEAGSIGANVNINNGADYNEKGITPAIGMPAEGKEESTTKSTIAAGEIEIRDKENQKQDLAGLNRDTQNSLNKLGEIFDKDSIKEKQELAGLFGELAYNQIHNIDGTPEQKAALHALVGGIMGELTGSGFLAGASGAAVNKLLSDELKKIAGDDPALHQWLSAALGAVVSDVVAGNAQAGSSAAASGTKNNDYYEEWLAQQGIDPSKTQITEVDNPETILGGGNLDLSVSVIMAITGEGLADLTAQMADTIKIDTSSISPSMNIAYNTGVSNKSKVILQNVSKVADKAITIGTGVYSVYMDSTKYNDLSLIGAVTLDVGSLYLINSTDKIVVDKFGTSKPMIYGIKTMSGTVAYLVDENVLTPIKKNWDDFVQGRNE